MGHHARISVGHIAPYPENHLPELAVLVIQRSAGDAGGNVRY
jgi:hypothetical protein